MEGNRVTKNISKRPTGLIYLDRNRAFYYEQRLASPISFDIPPDTITDLEVINKKKLDVLIKNFVSANTLVPTNIAILLSTSVTFEKEIPQGGVDADKSFAEFLEFVPFEDYLSKRIQVAGKDKVVAANKEICDAIENAFQSLGFVATGVYPLSFCLDIMPELATNLDLNSVLNKIPEMKTFNLLPTMDVSENVTKKEKVTNKRLPILIGVFGFLILILLFFVYKNIIAPKPTRNLPKVVAPPAPTFAPPPATSSGNLQPTVTSSESGNIQNPQ